MLTAPMSAGYSPRPLVEKLGLKPGARAALIHAPKGYAASLGPLSEGVRLATRLGREHDFLQAFFDTRRALARELPALARRLVPDGMLWVSWPKQASGVETDVTEDVVREIALPLGLVDVKVCAVDETWSGLKLVRRRELRTGTVAKPRRPSGKRATGR
jgi:hypothetical protein